MSRYLSPVCAVLIWILCGPLVAEVQEKQQVEEEASFELPLLQKAEIVEIVPATWAEIADRCPTEQPVDNPESQGRLMTLRVGKDTYRMFLSGARAIQCLESGVSEEAPAEPVDRGLQEIADLARKDLGERLEVSPGDIELVRAERVTWRDSSAGCPESGQMYMPVLTPGARIVLKWSGVEYRYHQVAGAAPFLCKSPSPIEPLPGPEIQ